MILYHGTSDKFLPRILANGIEPRNITKTKGNFAHTIQGATDRVYLTDAYAPYFAEICAGEQGGVPTVIVIDSDKISGKLVADEDAIEQVERATSKLGKITKKLMFDRTRRFRKDAEFFEDNGIFTYENSLNCLGTCAVVGTVDKDAILGYYTLHKGKTWQVFDPTITLANYQFMKTFYRYASEVAWAGKSDSALSEFDLFRWQGKKPDDVINSLIAERKILNERGQIDYPAQLPCDRGS